jgi:multiple sugar transport system permease protein
MTDALANKASNPRAVLTAAADHSEGMSYLETLPRRLVTLYLPLSIILLVLLFPFYWMALTSIKPDDQLLDMDRVNPFWTTAPTLKHFYNLLFQTSYPLWL